MNAVRRLLVASSATLIALLLLTTTPVSAHTGFESSEPADGSTSDEAIGEIIIRFSGAADPVGEGFVVLDPSGVVRAPDSVMANTSKTVWTLGFDAPLAGGDVGVRWAVQAPDAHPIDGSFSFTIDALLIAADGPVGNADETAIGAEPNTSPAQPSRAANTGTLADTPPAASELEAFLSESTMTVPRAEGIGAFGRLLGFIGTMLGIGGLVFAAYVIRDRRPDIVSVLKAVRYAALIVVVGTAIDLTAHLAIANNGWGSAWSTAGFESVAASAFGVAIGLRSGAGLLLFVAAGLASSKLPLYAVPAVPALALTGGGTKSPPGAGPRRPDKGSMSRSIVIEERTAGPPVSPSVVISVLLLLASFTFDGHTVTEGDRWVTGAVDMVHVVAGSIWAGGVVAFAVVLWRRHRRSQRLNSLELAVRFSVPAGAALAVAGLAGSLLAAIILDEVAALWTTSWGQLLIAKFVTVAAAASVGTYNHFVVIPWLSYHPEDDARSIKLRNTVTAEAVLLIVVITVTAFLVGATSS